MEDRTYRFADFELIPAEGLLRKGHSTVRLQEKPLLLLLALIENPQCVVTRKQLRERMWGTQTFVDHEQGINVAVKKVRDGLGDSAESPRFIETIAKKGYRFLLPVEVGELRKTAGNGALRVEIPPPAKSQTGVSAGPVLANKVPVGTGPTAGIRKGWIRGALTVLALAGVTSLLLYLLRASPAQTGIKSIAVLPLQNLSTDPEQEYFADGITDELITDLAKVHGLRVISRTSIMRYKRSLKPLPEIAQELNVEAVVEGTILRSADRVRIRVQLIDARTDSHLWAEVYERDQQDSLSLQNEVADAIARHVDLELAQQDKAPSASSRRPNFEAYSAYLKGRYEWNKRTPESLRKSIQYFEEAIEKDPNYALGHEGLAEAYNVASDYNVLPPVESYSKAKSEALRALELDNGLGPAHATLASVKEEQEWDWAGADEEFRRAIELSPSNATAHQWYSEYLLRVGRIEEGLAEMKQAEELDPGSPLMNAELGAAFYWARQYDQAIQQLEKAIVMEPGFAYAHSWLGYAYEQKGRKEEAIEEFQKAVNISGGSSTFLAGLGHAYAHAGNERESRKILEKLKTLSKKSYVSPYDMAIINVGLGAKDEALRWLEIGYTAREPALDSLRSDPRYQNLIRQVGLPSH